MSPSASSPRPVKTRKSPKPKKVSIPTAVRNVDVVVSETQGPRDYMEDTHVHTRLKNGGILLAVFDGHGGDVISKMAAKNVVRLFEKSLKTHKNEEDAMKTTYIELENLAKHLCEQQRGSCIMGTTAVVTYIHPGRDKITMANAGDSKAVYVWSDKIEDFIETTDHTPDSNSEKKRIKRAGGLIMEDEMGKMRMAADGRPALAVSRAIGDLYIKKQNSGLIETPDIFTVAVDGSGMRLLVLASDGVWGEFSASVMTYAYEQVVSKEETYQEIADWYVNNSVTKTGDNTTIILAIIH